MKLRSKTILATALLSGLALPASAQTARDFRGPSPYEQIDDEAAPRLIVDPPLAEPLKIGVFQAQFRVENMRIVPVFGAAALQVSPRVGHLHISVDDHPFLWADASDDNTIDVAFLTSGKHKVTIQLVDPTHQPVPGQVKVLEFTVPDLTGSHH